MGILYRSIDSSEMETWYDHVNQVFNVPREYFVNHHINDPWTPLTNILIAEDSGIIASTVKVFSRRIFVRGAEITMGGIGEVSTKVEYRGKGHSSNLLRRAIELMNSQGMQISSLGTGLFSHYGKLGWQRIFIENVKLVLRVGTPEPSSRLPEIRPICFDSDIPFMMRAYSELNGNLTGGVVRDAEEYWQRWVRTETGSNGVIISVEGNPAAYARMSSDNDAVRVEDMGLLDEYRDRLPDILMAISHAKEKTVVVFRSIVEICESRIKGFFEVIEAEPISWKMYMLIDGYGLMHRLLDGKSCTRLKNAQMSLAFESGGVILSVKEGILRVSDNPTHGEAVPTVSLSDEELTLLILKGYYALPGERRASLPSGAAMFLEEVFPKIGMVCWGTDSF